MVWYSSRLDSSNEYFSMCDVIRKMYIEKCIALKLYNVETIYLY